MRQHTDQFHSKGNQIKNNLRHRYINPKIKPEKFDEEINLSNLNLNSSSKNQNINLFNFEFDFNPDYITDPPSINDKIQDEFLFEPNSFKLN